MNSNIIDPWNLSQEFLLKSNEINIIKGPCKVIKNINNINKTFKMPNI